MRKRPAILVGLGAVLLSAVAALPLWFGRQAEKTYRAITQQLAGSSVRITTATYKRGWLSSNAKMVLTLPWLPVEVSAIHRIGHGPFPLDRLLEGELHPIPVQARVRSDVTLVPRPPGDSNDAPETRQRGRPPVLTADTTIALDGSAVVHAKSSSRRIGAGSGVFELRGLTLDLTFDRRGRRVTLDTAVPHASFAYISPQRQPVKAISFSGLRLRSDLKEGVGVHLFGVGSVMIDRLELGASSYLRGVRLAITARPNRDAADITITTKVQELSIGGETYGPARLVVGLRKLDAATLAGFEHKVNAIYRKSLPREQASLIVLGEAIKTLAKLAKTAPELEVTELSVKGRHGGLAGRARVVLDGSRLNVAANPMLLLTALRGDAELTVSAEMLKVWLAPAIERDIEAIRRRGMLSQGEADRLGPAVTQKIIERALPLYLSRHDFTRYLVPDGSGYRATASIRRGRFLINNEPWHAPLATLQ